jgi:hypothetical protein
MFYEIRQQNQEIKLLNQPISPRSLRGRGAAILQALNKNHHIVILEIKLINPLAYTAACEAVCAIDDFAFSSSFVSRWHDMSYRFKAEKKHLSNDLSTFRLYRFLGYKSICTAYSPKN